MGSAFLTPRVLGVNARSLSKLAWGSFSVSGDRLDVSLMRWAVEGGSS